MTRQPYQGSPEWHAERRTGYGASDAPILVEGDEADWRQLHGEKLGLLEPREASETMDLGKRLEDVIARAYAERIGERLTKVNRIIRHPEHAFVFASLDRKRRGGRPVEVKKWAYKGDDWGPAGSDMVPTRILYQVQQQAAVTGADAVDLAVLFGGAKLEAFTVGRDESIIGELIALEVAAWAFVARGEMPPWPGQAPKRITLAHDEVPVDDTLRTLVNQYEGAAEFAKGAAEQLEEAKDRIRAVLADAGGAKGQTSDGRRLSISHRPQEPSPRVAWELVAKAYRKALEDVRTMSPYGEYGDEALDAIESMFTTTPAAARPLRITIGKGTP